MHVPSGLNVYENQKSVLGKAIYGLIQKAKNFYKKLIEVLKVIGFIGN
jgi:hypothetical protein